MNMADFEGRKQYIYRTLCYKMLIIFTMFSSNSGTDFVFTILYYGT